MRNLARFTGILLVSILFLSNKKDDNNLKIDKQSNENQNSIGKQENFVKYSRTISEIRMPIIIVKKD